MGFSRIRTSIDIPDLIEIQKRSHEEFLQMEVEPDRPGTRVAGGVSERVSNHRLQQYGSLRVFQLLARGRRNTTSGSVLEQGMTFAVPLKLRVRLIVFDKEDKGPKKKVLDVREQEVYVGELPLMTERGTFPY